MKILIVSLDNLGDAVMASAIVDALRERESSVELGLWVKEYTADLFSDDARIKHIHASDPFWDGSPGRKSGSVFTFLKVWKKIRSEQYDIAIILNTEWRRSFFCWLAGISVRVGFDRRKSRVFLSHAYVIPQETMHVIDQEKNLLENYFEKQLNARNFIPRLSAASEKIELLKKKIASWGWNMRKIVIVHPFSGDDRKNWDPSKWLFLMQQTTSSYPDVRFILMASLSEQVKLESSFPAEPQDLFHPVVISDLQELKAVLNAGILFIGGDSGPGHVAGALKIPVISLFGPTNPLIYGVRGAGTVDIIIEESMQKISVERVMSVLHKKIYSLL